jgi:hypothetical protein
MTTELEHPIHYYTWEAELKRLIDQFNDIYAMVLVNGTAKIAQVVKQPNQRPYVTFLSLGGFKAIYSNTSIKTGEIVKAGRNVDLLKTHAQAWIASPDRKTYLNAIYAPHRHVESTTLNTWIDSEVAP